MKLIYLTSEQADKVRGRHGKYSALEPVATDNGAFVLPIEVLDDPEHAEVLKDLEVCKFVEIDIKDVVDAKLPEDSPQKIKQVLSVKSVSPEIIKVEKEMIVKPTYTVIKSIEENTKP